MKKNVLGTDKLFLPNKNRTIINWTKLFEHMFIEGTIKKEDAKLIIQTATKFMGNLKSE
jgi:hypothetical protein